LGCSQAAQWNSTQVAALVLVSSCHFAAGANATERGLKICQAQLDAARSGFEELETHPLAFADHAAEFYAGSGNDCRRALELARANLANRPTRRALKQVQTITMSAGEAAGRTAGSSADDMTPGGLIARRPAHSVLG